MTKKPIKESPKQIPVETNKSPYPYADQEDVFIQCTQHYQWWNDDNEKRVSREGGWKEIMDGYWGKLPEDWPFISRTVDPRIRTSLIEKNARLTKNQLRGKVLPRENADILKARLNNALIEYQWDTANNDGSMQSKLSTCDMDTRLNGSKFAYVYWRTVKDKNGKLITDGNEMMPLDINDCGMDPNCNHIRGARWFQHRVWKPLEDLRANENLYPGLPELLSRIEASKTPGAKVSQQKRSVDFTVMSRQNLGLEDRMGEDKAFPVVKIVIEYREDKWITFCPDFDGVILSIQDNPYDHGKIPITQLRYYPLDGDNLGESEVAAVLGLWKAIQAVVCAYLDEVILKMRPPLKIVEGAARIETLIYQPEAQWLMDNVNAVQEMGGNGDSIRYFQNTYPALVSAFNVAMGDLSQGISNLDPKQSGPASATEIRQLSKQQNIRDQKNQQELAEFIKDIVSMWIVNNKQFLFRKKNKKEYILRIAGGDAMSYFQKAGLDQEEAAPGASQEISKLIEQMADNGVIPTDGDIANMYNAAKIPKFPIISNPEEQDNTKLEYKPKMTTSEMGDGAEITLIKEDLDGMYDYVPDMRSMESSSSDQSIMAKTQAITTMTNPNILTILQQENVKPLIKDILIALFEETGLKDAQKFFESVQPQPTAGAIDPTTGQPIGATTPGGSGTTGSVLPSQPGSGMANPPKAPTQPSVDQQMAGSNILP